MISEKKDLLWILNIINNKLLIIKYLSINKNCDIVIPEINCNDTNTALLYYSDILFGYNRIDLAKISFEYFNKKNISDFLKILLYDVFQEIREKFEKYDNPKYNDQTKKIHNYVAEFDSYVKLKETSGIFNFRNVDELNNYLRDHSNERAAIIKSTKGFAENIVSDFDYEAMGFRKKH